MGSGMLGLSIGKSALQAQQRALETTSQNLANANTEGYTRKVVTLASTTSLNLPDTQGPVYTSQIGTGVQVAKIESVRDLLLNSKIRDLSSDFQDSDKTKQVLDQVESLFTGEIDLPRSIDDFFASLQDLAGSPDSLTVRAVVRARGVELADRIKTSAESVEDIRVNMAQEMASKVNEINSITTELAGLNNSIGAMVSANLSPNDFEDKRQVLLEKLGKIGDVKIVEGPASSLTVILASQVVVQGTQSFAVSATAGPSDGLPVLSVGPTANQRLDPHSGVLRAFADLQTGTLQRLRGDLNELAISLQNTFNTIHRAGFGLDESTGVDFFSTGTPPATETRVFSVLGTGFVPEPTVALDGISTTIQPENFETNPIGKGNFNLNGRSIAYDGSVDSLQTVVDRINASGANITATITPENRLLLSAGRNADYTISLMSDSGGNFLTRMGIFPSSTSAFPPTAGTIPPSSAFSGTVSLRPSDDVARRMAVSNAVLRDLNKIAAAKGEDLTDPPDGRGDRSRGPGDGANALLLAGLQGQNVMTGATATFNQFVVGMMGTVGVEAGAALRSSEGLNAQIKQLQSRREEIQGVSIDEELVNMIKYQRGFQAASKIINVMDEVLQTLLGLGK